ncbi:ABC transporter substrate-binding protein [Mangrovicella endophytica]|uniref:ABC transporter substrate-binding protein n=1 Tax=Mangrovicella endophytica TaxID=2066697 RepID=UPI000C9DDDC5|nr:extracellular solute-binding protein [Mangrovicella endophytica]
MSFAIWMKSIAAGAALTLASAAWAEDVPLYHDKGFWSQQFQAVGDAAKEKTGVRIVQTSYAPPEQYKAFVQSSIASGNPPDLFTWWTGASFKELIATGKIAVLDDVWDEMVKSGQYEESTRDLFKVDGKTYAVPFSMSRWVVLYNKKMFADNGLSEPKSWGDMMAAADKLKAAGITPFNASVQEGWRGFIWFEELMIRTNPAAYKGLHDGTVGYDDPAVRKAFQIWSDMYAKGYFTDPRSNEEAQDFARGKAAMYLIGEWAEGLVDTAGLKPDTGFGAFIMPNVDAGLPSSVIVEAGPIVVSTAGKEKKDVMTAVNFWTSVDGANVWAKSSGNFEGNVKADAPNPTVAKITADMMADKAVLMERWWEAVPPDLQGELVAELNGFMVDPTMQNAEAVMGRMQALNADYWESRK